MDQALAEPFDIDEAMRRLAVACGDLPEASLFRLAEEGFGSAFQVLAACLISVRTIEAVTLDASRRLFAEADTPAAVAALPPDRIDALISPSTFHERKAVQLRDIAALAVRDHGGELPCDYGVLIGLRGVGPKCANLILGIACGTPRGIGVDIHVHRVTNRWGYVSAPTPPRTMAALEEVLPKAYWLEINRRLVPFGKYICTGRRPKCSTCPLASMCAKVGVA